MDGTFSSLSSKIVFYADSSYVPFHHLVQECQSLLVWRRLSPREGRSRSVGMFVTHPSCLDL